MKNKSKELGIFILFIGLLTFLIQIVYMIMTENGDPGSLDEWFSNFPATLLLGFIVMFIVHRMNKHKKYKDNLFKRVLLEISIVSLLSIAYTILIKYSFSPYMADYDPKYSDYLKSITAILLGTNFSLVMLELFFYNQRQVDAEKRIAEIEKEKAEYQYASLKTQINPHFLFNSLNVLSSLTFEDPIKANKYTKKLSKMYRYVLETGSLMSVSVEDEIKFLESYNYLLSIRFENNLFININGNKKSEKQLIPLSIQLLVENAVKHNIASLKQPLTVDINIMDDYIEVVNNLQLRTNSKTNGIGLSNLQKQYHLYSKKIEIRKTNNQFIVRIPYLPNNAVHPVN